MIKFFDDGNYNWEYKSIYSIPTNNKKDYYYYISFETEDGGYMTSNEICCHYYNEKNILSISKGSGYLRFYVENFQDIHKILKPLIKAHKATIYPLYESNIFIRKEKIKYINKKSVGNT